ncbi:MAG: TSUP family transporter [Breznakia sp.]
MMIILIYSLLTLLATTIGAIAGLGGGVIMKPFFDLLGIHSPSIIGIYSSMAVFTMCSVSIYKQIKNGVKINKEVVLWVSLGSFIGGFFGETIFHAIASNAQDIRVIKSIQAFSLMMMLMGILWYTKNQEKCQSYNISNPIMILIIGILLGSVSVFLGIGGGPLNVAVFTLFFSFALKDAMIASLATIFFAQVSKLGQVIFTQQYIGIDKNILLFICIAAVLGGLLGTKINRSQKENSIRHIYIYTLYFLIFLSFINGIKAFF